MQRQWVAGGVGDVVEFVELAPTPPYAALSQNGILHVR